MTSPLATTVLFHLGSVPISSAVGLTWAIMGLLTFTAVASTRNLSLTPSRFQTVVEVIVEAVDSQIADTMGRPAAPYRALIGTLFLYILVANWSSLVPGVVPPTAHIETDAAMAVVVFFAAIYYGVKARGVRGYLSNFAQPSFFMIPLNIAETFTRTFSMTVRLFGNVMSGVFVIGVVLSLAGLFVPIPLMALDLLTGAIQAYIFTILSVVFIGSAVGENVASQSDEERKTT